MTKTEIQTKRLEKNVADDNIAFEPSLQLVAGACNQLYQPLFVAHDIQDDTPFFKPVIKGGRHAE